MKITKLTLYKLEIPMVTAFTTSFGSITTKPTVIVRVESDSNIEGWGEAAALPFPFYKPETTDICMLVLGDYIAPLILNKKFETVEELIKKLNVIKNHNFAKTGLETAVWMITSLQEQKPLKELLGGTQDRIAVGESIGIKDTIEETLEEISLRLKQGFQRTKIKIKPGWDIDVVKAIRRKFGDIPLMVDANSAYTLKDIEVFKKLDSYQLIMIEQPLADDDLVDHSILQGQIKTSVCLDESIHSVEDARRAIFLNSCQIINIKPGRVGGLLESKKIHDLCKRYHLGVWCGGMLETGIGRAFNIAVASLPNFIYPADMSPTNFFYAEDLIEPTFKVGREGYIKTSNQPGLGYQVVEKRIEKY
jgi:O-succinylbenzoate synthase